MKTLLRSRDAIRITLLFFLALTGSMACAQGPFQEDDWIAWGDSRTVRDLSVGQEVIYVATSAGVHRYDRFQQVWLTPWFSVPLTGNRMILLQNVRNVREDPLTHEVYVLIDNNSWLRRDLTSGTWDEVDPPDGDLNQRLARGGAPAKPASGLIAPLPFQVDPDGNLRNTFVSWKFTQGIEDELGPIVYGWKGFGFGTRDRYSVRIDLFPAGPGPSPGMDVTSTDIWCAGKLNRNGGWVWHRNRASNAWEFF
ncbi:MAG: hypothetical protein V2A56_10100, partial [bacterium]